MSGAPETAEEVARWRREGRERAERTRRERAAQREERAALDREAARRGDLAAAALLASWAADTHPRDARALRYFQDEASRYLDRARAR